MSWRNYSNSESASFRKLLPAWGEAAVAQTCPHCSAKAFRWYSSASKTRTDGVVWQVWCSDCRSFAGQTSYIPGWNLPDPLDSLNSTDRSQLVQNTDEFFAELDRLWELGVLPQIAERDGC